MTARNFFSLWFLYHTLKDKYIYCIIMNIPYFNRDTFPEYIKVRNVLDWQNILYLNIHIAAETVVNVNFSILNIYVLSKYSQTKHNSFVNYHSIFHAFLYFIYYWSESIYSFQNLTLLNNITLYNINNNINITFFSSITLMSTIFIIVVWKSFSSHPYFCLTKVFNHLGAGIILRF